MTTNLPALAHHLGGILLAAAPPAAEHGHAAAAPADPMNPVLSACLIVALAVMAVGLLLCLYRVVRGPSLSDRVLAADLLALHVVGVVIVLTIYLEDMVFFDAALAVGILGFVSTVGFAQYIHGTAPSTPPPTPEGRPA